MDEVKKGVANVARSIAQGSGKLVRTTKLTLDLSSAESKLKSLYTEIGKKVHEIYSYGGSLGEFFDQKYQEILDLQKKIESIKETMDIAKGVKTCPKCGKTSPRASVFCPKCGETIGEGVETPPAPPTPEAPKDEKNCNVCGSRNAAVDKFCLSCGRMM